MSLQPSEDGADIVRFSAVIGKYEINSRREAPAAARPISPGHQNYLYPRDLDRYRRRSHCPRSHQRAAATAAEFPKHPGKDQSRGAVEKARREDQERFGFEG